MKYLSLLIWFVLFSWQAAAQTPIVCETPVSADNLKGVNLDSLRQITNYSTAKIVRVVFHILRNDDGSNAAATEAYLEAELQKIRNEYAPWDICFALVGYNYINNTTLNTLMNSNNSAHQTSLFANDWNNVLNIYCHQELRNNSGTGLIGTAYAIPNTHMSIDIPENFNGVLSHEIGHCLGLYHTFETFFGNELVNGSNCSTAGDLVCTTPADPNGAFNSSTCVYTGTTRDANNQLYTPQINNIMSYYFNCMTALTSGQRTRIYDTIAGNTSIRNMTTQINTLNATNVSYSSGSYWWNARTTLTAGNIAGAGNFTSTGTAKGYLTSHQVILKPGFRATPASGGKVRVLTYGCN